MHYEKYADGTVRCIEDEIPFEVPEGWAWTRINTVCVLNPRNNISDNLEVSFIPMSLIMEGYSKSYLSETRKWRDIKTGFTHFAMNDIGIAKITPCFENRKSVIFSELINGYGAGTTELHILRIINNMIVPEYLLWIVKTDSFIRGGIHSFSGAVGQQRVGKEFILQYLIPIPPKREQNKIIDKINQLFTFMEMIENSKADLQRIIKQTESKILDLAIRGRLVPQDPDDEPSTVLLERIRAEKDKLIKQGKLKRDKKESVIFRGDDNSYYQSDKSSALRMPFDIPESWTWSNLCELCDYGSCISVPAEAIPEDAWVLDLEDIEKDSGKIIQRLTNKERQTTSIKHVFQKNMVLYSKLRPYLNKVIIAEENGYCTSEILPLSFNQYILPQYAQILLMSPYFVNYANHCSYGMKMPRLGTKDGQKAYFPIPPYKEQIRIAKTVQSLYDNLHNIEKAI